MSKPKTPKTPQEPKILSPQQQLRLLDTFSRKGNLRDSTLILLVLKTGLKSGEACGLNVGDVLQSVQVVTTLEVRPEIATNKSARHLPLSKEVQNAIKDFLKWKQERGEYLEPTAPLFCTTLTNSPKLTEVFLLRMFLI